MEEGIYLVILEVPVVGSCERMLRGREGRYLGRLIAVCMYVINFEG